MVRRVTAVVITAIVLAACGSVASPTPEPTERPTPEPTPTPWTLDVGDATYTTEAFVGDTISIDVTVKNTGKKKSPLTLINFSDLDKYADLHRCKPKCVTEDLPGLGPSAVMGGVAPRKSIKFHVEFVATTVGVVEWSVCVYDNEDYADSIWCGDGKTAIR